MKRRRTQLTRPNKVNSTYTYDSYGNLTASTGSLVNSFRYTDREFDSETNLYYYRARYYDSGAGRFVGEDPLRFRKSFDFCDSSGASSASSSGSSGNSSGGLGWGPVAGELLFRPRFLRIPRLAAIFRCVIWWFFSPISLLPWPACSDLAVSIPSLLSPFSSNTNSCS